MKAALKFIVVASGLALLGFAVHDIISFGMAISTAASRAPKHFWDALGDAVAWSIEYKEGATAIFIVCVLALYLNRKPTIKQR